MPVDFLSPPICLPGSCRQLTLFLTIHRHFDKDKAGRLNHKEFKSCLRALGYDLPMVEEGQPDPEFNEILGKSNYQIAELILGCRSASEMACSDTWLYLVSVLGLTRSYCYLLLGRHLECGSLSGSTPLPL